MKKLITSVLLLTIPLLVGAFTGNAEVNGIWYSIDTDSEVATVVQSLSNNYSGDIVIPENIVYDGVKCNVTTIGVKAFYYSGLTSITIPISIKSIGNSAFSGCTGLKKVFIKDIAAWCKITFPAYNVGSNPLYYANNLYIDENTVITNIVVPNSVTKIESYAFAYCKGLTSVTISNSVTSIGDGAFSDCYGLTSVTIPNSVTSIGDRAFASCSSLTSVSIPNSVTSIGNSVFSYCSLLSSVTIPNSVTSIGDRAFESCNYLTSVTIPSSVKTIGEYCFLNCSLLDTITIPTSVISIGKGVLGSCSGLTSIQVESGNAIYDSRNDCNAIIESKSNTIIAGCMNTIIPSSVKSIAYGSFEGCKGLTELSIPNSVTDIGDYAFSGCIGLTELTIPNSVLSIGSHAFTSCQSLKTVVISNSLSFIGDYVFYLCTNLTSVTIPNSVTRIGKGAFMCCASLSSIKIPFTVTRIESYAFRECTGLLDVYCFASSVPSTVYDAFMASNLRNMTLYVPAIALENYKVKTPWNQFGTYKTIEEDIEPEHEQDFSKCATPTISYLDKKLVFSCATEDVEYVSEIKDNDIRFFYTNEVHLSATYEISVYAAKSGYENSDVATATLVWTDAIFTETTPETPTSAKEVKESIPVLISANGGVITVKSEQEGQPVAVYTADGKALGSANVKDGQATIATNMQRGEIVIVKVGGRSVKVKM